VFLLENPIQPYAWGSTTLLPSLLNVAPTGRPQAELWLGAHPSAPSTLKPQGHSLAVHVARAPVKVLGAASVQRFGPTLPFLFKVLAAGQPLSLQAHPSLTQAKEGYAREDAAGLPRHAPSRNYRDANHKPELICAVTPFHALCGFRRVADSVTLLRSLGLDTAVLEQRGLRAYFEWLMTTSDRKQLARAAVAACQNDARAECAWALKLGVQYPDDVGVIGALLLNLVTLAPGQALYLPAGNLHAYLEGLGVELMANSDNVLRGGLTPKHVDVAELLRVLDFSDGPVTVLEPADGVYVTPAPDFELSRVRAPATASRRGADVVLAISGSVDVSVGNNTLTLQQGQSVFIDADEGPTLTFSGTGTAYRATVGR
jgi:mannose-6-phosphate isomerase